MLAWIENHVVRIVLGGALLLWLAYEATGLVVAYSGDVRVTAALVAVAPEVGGPIAALPVRPDQTVQANQPLLTIEPRPFALAVAGATAARDVAGRQRGLAEDAVTEAAAAIDQARARLTDAQAILARDQTLGRSGYMPQERVQDAVRDAAVGEAGIRRAEAALSVARRLVDVRRAEAQAAAAALDRAAYDLSRTRVVSPLAGRIAPFDARPGDMAAPGQPVLTLVTDADWRLVANVAERHLRRQRPVPTARELSAVTLIGGLALVAVLLLWQRFDLPQPVQMAISALVVLDRGLGALRHRGRQRVAGCLLGGAFGLGAMTLGGASLALWLGVLGLGLFLFSVLHHGGGPSAYVGTQGGLAVIITLVAGRGPPASILPVVDRLAGATLGVLVLILTTTVVMQGLLQPQGLAGRQGGSRAGGSA